MPLDQNGLWYPDLSIKQLDVFNSRKRALLVCGPRLSGKTWTVGHKVIRHMWETPDARVAMFAKTMKNSKDGGSWSLLHKTLLPEWFASGIGINYTTMTSERVPGPKVDGQTRTPYFKLRNAFGGESTLMLFSLDYDQDVEDKLKDMVFSMIWFSELSKFRDRKILSVSLPSLRMPHLKYEQQQWIADTNPDEDGEASWIYGVWYRERCQTYEEYKEWNEKHGLHVLEEHEFLEHQADLGLVEIIPEENPWLDPRQLSELKRLYAYDAGLYARYVKGAWVFGEGDGSRHFRSFFRPSEHVLGNAEGFEEERWEVILPSDQCHSLITGFDLGETNHAGAIMERVDEPGQKSKFYLLEELVSIKQHVSIEHYTSVFMELIEDLESICNRQFNLESCYSDRSSIDKYSATADTFPHKQVQAASNNRLILIGVPKPSGSVRTRVNIVKQLLAEGRFFISAQCVHTIEMLKDLKKGTGKMDYVIADKNKHIFDAITYALYMELRDELVNNFPNLGRPPAVKDHRLKLQVR